MYKWVREVYVLLLPKMECCLKGIQYLFKYYGRAPSRLTKPPILGIPM